MQTTQPSATAPIEARRHFVHWTPVIAGAFVASALSLLLIAFGTSLGLAVASTAPTWRDTSPTLTVISGLYLVLTAAVSFGFGGYLAGRLRTSWDPALHREFVEFRDGTHGLVSWAVAVVISGLVAAVSLPPLRHESLHQQHRQLRTPERHSSRTISIVYFGPKDAIRAIWRTAAQRQAGSCLRRQAGRA